LERGYNGFHCLSDAGDLRGYRRRDLLICPINDFQNPGNWQRIDIRGIRVGLFG
jgi:hypothetical protein